MNLSPARLAIIVALVLGGIVVLTNGFDGPQGGSAIAGDATSPSIAVSVSPSAPPPSESPAQTPPPETEGVTLMVFNGTSTGGLADAVQTQLEGEGYIAPRDPANALTSTVPKTTVYYRGGGKAAQNESNATFLADEHLGGAAVKLLGADYEAVVSNNIQLVVVLGNDHPDAG